VTVSVTSIVFLESQLPCKSPNHLQLFTSLFATFEPELFGEIVSLLLTTSGAQQRNLHVIQFFDCRWAPALRVCLINTFTNTLKRLQELRLLASLVTQVQGLTQALPVQVRHLKKKIVLAATSSFVFEPAP